MKVLETMLVEQPAESRSHEARAGKTKTNDNDAWMATRRIQAQVSEVTIQSDEHPMVLTRSPNDRGIRTSGQPLIVDRVDIVATIAQKDRGIS